MAVCVACCPTQKRCMNPSCNAAWLTSLNWLPQRDPAFEAAIRQAAGELGLEADEEFVKNVVSLRWG